MLSADDSGFGNILVLRFRWILLTVMLAHLSRRGRHGSSACAPHVSDTAPLRATPIIQRANWSRVLISTYIV